MSSIGKVKSRIATWLQVEPATWHYSLLHSCSYHVYVVHSYLGFMAVYNVELLWFSSGHFLKS